MPTSRFFLTTAVANGKIYAIGGTPDNKTSLSVVEEYSPEDDKWIVKTDMPTPRSNMSSCVLDGKIYVIGGIGIDNKHLPTVEEYDPRLDKWTIKADMPTVRFDLCSSVVNGKIYAIGGLLGEIQKWFPLSTVEEYDPVSDIWTKKADMPTPRVYFSTCAIDNEIYAIGGIKDTINMASVIERYDPSSDKWIRDADMQTPRMLCYTGTVDKKVYVIGGVTPDNDIMTLVEEYDPRTASKSIDFKGKLPTTWGETKMVLSK